MRTLMIVLTSVLVGCSVPDDKMIRDFEQKDLDQFCDELATTPREVTCVFSEEEFTFTIGMTLEECLEDYQPDLFAACEVTAGQVRACMDAYDVLTDEEFCSLETGFPAECTEVAMCIFEF